MEYNKSYPILIGNIVNCNGIFPRIPIKLYKFSLQISGRMLQVVWIYENVSFSPSFLFRVGTDALEFLIPNIHSAESTFYYLFYDPPATFLFQLLRYMNIFRLFAVRAICIMGN